jgi:DNA-binding transcriptional LysR family regulator
MLFKMNDLKNFLVCSESRTIIEASKKLHISQPALSESIKRLESDLATVLFYRTREGISLTPQGRYVLEKSKAAMASISMIQPPDRKISNSQTIVLGCHPVVASYCLPQAFVEMQKHFPDYKIELRHDLSRNIQSEILKGRIDIGLVINPQKAIDLVVKKIAEDEVCVFSAKNRFNEEKLICNTELFQTQYILKKWKSAPTDLIRTDSLELITRLTENKIGYGIIPSRAVRLVGAHLLKHDDLPSFKDEIFLLFRPEFGKTSYEKMLIRCLEQSLET